MPVGPSRTASLAKKVRKKVVVKPVSQLASGTGVTGDIRPDPSMASNLQRAQWAITNRQTRGDWT